MKKIKAIDLPLRRSPTHRLRRDVVPSGKQAFTEILQSTSDGDVSLLKLKPHTGRTNQLRAHLAHIGHPIIYDRIYGSNVAGSRTMLHAYSLNVPSKSGKNILVIAPIPQDMRDLAESHGLKWKDLVIEN